MPVFFCYILGEGSENQLTLIILFYFYLDGIPTAYYFGQEGLHNILVIDMLGPSLEDLFDMCSRRFSVKTVAMLAKQMVKKNYTHNTFFSFVSLSK